MDRRAFLKLSAAFGAGAAAVYATSHFKGASAYTSPRLLSDLGGEPSPTDPMPEQLLIPHLLRRAGFGGSPAEQAQYEGMGFEEAVQYLLNYQSIDNSNLDAITPNIRTSYSGTVPTGQNEGNNLATWWLNRMVQTPRPLEEKMTLFWHNHFATAISKVQNGYLMYQQNQMLRSNALGNFGTMMTDVTWDGAMLIWLDGVSNLESNPNQNYAREVMEVFTTGRGPYTQNDVIEGANAFTGFYIDSLGQGQWNPAKHYNLPGTFLGITEAFTPQQILDILVPHPSTAANLSTELFEFFAYPNPSQDTIDRLSQVYLNSGYDIYSLVEAILTSAEFQSNQAYLANVKSPTEYVVGSLRALNATVTDRELINTTSNQGQLLFDPPTVFGWPIGINWINTGSIMERFNFPLNIQTTQQNSASGLNPDEHFGPGMSNGVQDIANILFPDGMPSEYLSVIEGAVSNYTDPTLMTKEAVRLTMASPFYNLN
jgi:uncharacterized protein (DUF1800 family)